MCQYSDKTVVRPVSNVMNTYKNERGQTAVIASSEKEIDNPNGKWILQKPDESAVLMSPKAVSGVVSETTQAVAASAALSAPSALSDAGDYKTGFAKGASLKQPSNI